MVYKTFDLPSCLSCKISRYFHAANDLFKHGSEAGQRRVAMRHLGAAGFGDPALQFHALLLEE
jgi:hypothetical protein